LVVVRYSAVYDEAVAAGHEAGGAKVEVSGLIKTIGVKIVLL
jgi:hypothetical protein